MVPEEAYKFVGTPLPGTRFYEKKGPIEELEIWAMTVTELCEARVSPGGAAAMVGVSRAAVHKRIKDGRLTGFFFYPTSERKSLFGKTVRREGPYIDIPCSELEAWREELEERALRQEKVTLDELEGRSPDDRGDFYEWRSKWRKQKKKEAEKNG